MNAVTAPTPASPTRIAATSAPRSKSAVCTVTRSVAMSASRHWREERQFTALFADGRFVAEHLIERDPQGLAAGQSLRVRRVAGDQCIAHLADAAARRDVDGL